MKHKTVDYRKHPPVISFNRVTIDTMVWRSILDDKTCDECRERHGRRLTKKQIEAGLGPPLHGNPQRGYLMETHTTGCRCVLIPLKETQKFAIDQMRIMLNSTLNYLDQLELELKDE